MQTEETNLEVANDVKNDIKNEKITNDMKNVF